MEIGSIRQIILYVKNMQKQVEFYRDTLGLKIGFPHLEDYSNEAWVSFSTGECTLALHSGGNGDIGSDAPKFTFEVSNVEQTKKQLREKGVKMGEIVEAYPDSYVCSGLDPEGYYFFVQSHPK